MLFFEKASIVDFLYRGRRYSGAGRGGAPVIWELLNN